MFTLLIPVFALVVAQQDRGELARIDRVMKWAAKADAASCAALAGSPLTDRSADIRQRAATALYARCDREAIAKSAAANLCRSIALGNTSAGAYLLLGFAHAKVAEPCLRKPYTSMVKLAGSLRPVPAAFVAQVALARLGDAGALAALRNAFDKNTVDDALFLLAALDAVQDREALESAVRLLDDKRDAPGTTSDTRRRLQDWAADALIRRFNLHVGHTNPESDRYSDDGLAEIKASALQALRAASKP